MIKTQLYFLLLFHEVDNIFPVVLFRIYKGVLKCIGPRKKPFNKKKSDVDK